MSLTRSVCGGLNVVLLSARDFKDGGHVHGTALCCKGWIFVSIKTLSTSGPVGRMFLSRSLETKQFSALNIEVKNII